MLHTDIEKKIEKAIHKVGGKKENDLCKFLPTADGAGYMHHFTLRKMRHKTPKDLCTLIDKYILNVQNPVIVPPKARAARGSRKRREQLGFSKVQLEKMLHIARLAGDQEMVMLLSPRRSLVAARKELIASIRQGKLEQSLWDAYKECVISASQPTSANSEPSVS